MASFIFLQMLMADIQNFLDMPVEERIVNHFSLPAVLPGARLQDPQLMGDRRSDMERMAAKSQTPAPMTECLQDPDRQITENLEEFSQFRQVFCFASGPEHA